MRYWSVLLVIAACGHDRAGHAPVPTPTPATAHAAALVPLDAGTAVTHALRTKDLFERADLIGKEVDVDMYESMFDWHHSSLARPGVLDVAVVDVGANRLELAWADDKPLMMRDIDIPVRVHATLRQGQHGLRLEATRIDHFPFPPPVTLNKPSDILQEPSKFSGTLVTFEAEWLDGFEVSLVDKEIWMEGMPGLETICPPPPPPEDDNARFRMNRSRVRVVGIAYAGGRYGHLGRFPGQILARQIRYLDTNCP